MKENKNTPIDVAENVKVLRWFADAYEQAQRVRLGIGEQIRAVLQGRDETWSVEVDPDIDAATMLRDILGGKTDGPVPELGVTYRLYHDQEMWCEKHIKPKLEGQPAWVWLKDIQGIGPVFACKLIGRLDPALAKHASSFSAYCGLATVPAHEYYCRLCGLRMSFPVAFAVTGKHVALNSKSKNCKGKTLIDREYDPEADSPRCAQPKPAKGQKAMYDQYMKKTMHVIASQFVRQGDGPYERIYRTERNRLERDRPYWSDGRQHNYALRKIQKLFLSHLWEVMREGAGLPVSDPYPQAHLGHNGKIDPWSMTGK